jgi:hypothetical protein
VVSVWQKTRRIQFARRSASPPLSADAELRAIARRHGLTGTGALAAVADELSAAAGGIAQTERRRIAQLFGDTGFESCDPSLIVSDLLAATATLV